MKVIKIIDKEGVFMAFKTRKKEDFHILHRKKCIKIINLRKLWVL